MRSRLAVRILAVWVFFFTIALLGPAASASLGAVGTITEFQIPTPYSNSWDITAGPDGNLWFVEEGASKIGKITPTGVITEFSPPTPGTDPRGITAGPDGNVWFTEGFADKIGRITPAGVITEFPVPLPPGCDESFLWDITTGPDGNLWFTDLFCVQIGRMTPSGVVTAQFAQKAESITAGPDGNLWFMDASNVSGSSIGRTTTSGVVAEFPVPGSPSLGDITSGPDGNVWFTIRAKPPQVGRITTVGAISLFEVPTPSMPEGITSGPDRNLWFTEYEGNKIGQITVTGRITEFPILQHFPHPSPNSIISGPDANLWFIEYEANKIGRITDAPAPVAPLTPNSGPPGTQVQVSGSNYGSFETVVLTFVDSVNGKTNLGRVLADASGKFSVSITIPTSATPGPQTVRVRGSISALVSDSTFTVT
jgi:streptogramin lyase